MRSRQTVWSSIKVILLAAVITAAVSACGSPAGGDGKSPVFLIASGSNAVGTQVDVYNASYPGGVSDEFFDVTIRSEYKNPTYRTNPPSTPYADVILQEYRVTYYRVDGNPDVPEPFTMQLSGIIPAGGEYDLNLLLLRSDAKLKSPLKELAFGGGEGEIHLQALIEFFGEDLMGNHVSTSMVAIIDALDL